MISTQHLKAVSYALGALASQSRYLGDQLSFGLISLTTFVKNDPVDGSLTEWVVRSIRDILGRLLHSGRAYGG
jgi:hypothetical protein